MIMIRACRLRRRPPAASPRPAAVCSQSCKRSFLRSLFFSSGTTAYVHSGFPPKSSCGGMGYSILIIRVYLLFVIITIYSLLMVETLKPGLFVGLVLDGIRLLGISRTMVVSCLNPYFSNISAVK